MSFTFAVPDLHGRYDLLEEAIERIGKYKKKGTVVFLGDYIDRGPFSSKIIRVLKEGPKNKKWKWKILKGNHEDMMVGVFKGIYNREWWLRNGGETTLNSYFNKVPSKHIKWLDSLKSFYVDDNRFFVHAGVNPNIPLKKQDDDIFLWMRTDRDYSYKGLYVVHGHTPHKNGPVIMKGRINLDTGAYFTGRLVIAVFDDDVPGKPVDFIEIERHY